MAFLTQEQIDAFRDTGCIVCEKAVSARQLDGMNAALEMWIGESREQTGPYGQTYDDRPRFDVEPDHSAEKPALRRVASPTEISDVYLDVIKNSSVLDMLEDLIGPDIRFHHSKINSKLPGSGTVVDWHQDFTFDPHSNDDVITCLVYLDDIRPESGPLMTAPGSHQGPLLSLWHDGVFTGAVAKDVGEELDIKAVSHPGPAGSVCIMHGRVAHASLANTSDTSRNLFIFVVAAADAVPLAPNPVPSTHMGMLLRGNEPGRIRSMSFEMEAPEIPKGASFFTQQSGLDGKQ